MAREINLVPDIKNDMIKAIKLRNLILFICIIVSVASVAAILISGTIAGGQSVAINSKENTINTMSEKVHSFNDLSEYLTIKNQVDDISTATSNKQVFSRTFNVIYALIQPVLPDEVTVSSLNVNLEEDTPVFSIEAQANATREPFIDYNVLDSFKKGMQYLKYDYGNYVDKNGTTIPSYCIIETADDGSIFKEYRDSKNNYYAYWTINAEGCDPSATDEDTTTSDEYQLESYNDTQVVKIWRTPQFSEWYHAKPSDSQPNITLDGTITNVAHFESQCTKYTGDTSSGDAFPTWTSTNDNCRVVPDNADGTPDITINESSNGRDSSDNLVLRFSATISISPEVYAFSNHHMLLLPVSDRYNVTDSYVQIQNIFGERAADCEDDDEACKNNGGNNG